MEKQQDNSPKITSFFFTFRFTAGGILDSEMSLENTRKELVRNLQEIYGEEGFEITEFRVASDKEVEAFIKFTKEQQPTIN